MIGYVGLGAMGRALARHLVPHGLVVWDLAPAAIDEMAASGAVPAASLSDLASRCGTVFLCLPKSDDVEAALFGTGGIVERLAPGAVVVDQTSGVPERTRGFAEHLTSRGIALVDAPVAGGVPAAIAGQITIMASGPEDAFARVAPTLAAISPKVFHCSARVGDGQAIKAINNLVNTGYRMATLELLGLARRMGLSAATVTDRLNSGPARSFVTQRLLPAVVEGRASADFALGLMCKDVNQAADLALASGIAMPVSDAARSLMTTAWNVLGPDSRLDDLVPFMERATGGERVAGNEPDDGSAADLIERGMAAANRATITESIELARRTGLDPVGFAKVMSAGSGASEQADRLFQGENPAAGLDGRIEALDGLARAAARLGVPLTVLGQVRAECVAGRTATRGTTA